MHSPHEGPLATMLYTVVTSASGCLGDVNHLSADLTPTGVRRQARQITCGYIREGGARLVSIRCSFLLGSNFQVFVGSLL